MHNHRTRLSLPARLVVVATLFCLFLAFFAGAAPAFAQSGRPRLKLGIPMLESAYRREQNWLSLQTDNLNRGDQVIAKLETYINNQNSQGKDTSRLAAEVAKAKTAMTDAHSAHDAAASTLAAHAGFDANGKVTDQAQAHQTVISAVQSLWKAHRLLYQALRDVRNALHTYRQAHPES